MKAYDIMFRLHLALAAIAVLTATARPTTAAAFEANAKFITMGDGLSNNTVRAIYQDSKGFVWMASLNGLNRYDGNSMKTIMPNGYGANDRRIRAMAEDSHGHLWLLTTSDIVCCYDLSKGRFVDFTDGGDAKKRYRSMTFMPGATWLWGNDGCLRVTFSQGQFKAERFDTNNHRLGYNAVREVLPWGDKAWVVTRRGLYLWRNGQMACVDSKADMAWAHSHGASTLFAESNGHIWRYANGKMQRLGQLPGVKSIYDMPGQMAIGNKWFLFTAKGGTCVDMTTGTIKQAEEQLDIKMAKVTTDNKGDYWLYNNTGNVVHVNRNNGHTQTFRLMTDKELKTIDQERYHIVQGQNGIIWIATYGSGLYAYDTRLRQLRHYTASDISHPIVQSDHLLCIAEDRSGNIWTGAWQAGASLIRIAESGTYQAYTDIGPVRTIAQCDNGFYIANTKGQLATADKDLGNITTIGNDGGNIYAAMKQHDGTLWLGSRTKGVAINGKWHTHNDADKASIGNNAIYAILSDKQQRVWVATLGGGLNMAQRNANGTYNFKHFLNKPGGTRHIRCLATDNNGWIWAGTSEGLVVFNPNSIVNNPNDYITYNTDNNKLLSNEVRSIMRDSKGRMWIAETGEGFCTCTPANNYNRLEFKHYRSNDGLANSMVQAFAEDNQKHIWISTEYGLSRFSPETGAFRNFIFAPTVVGNTYSENCSATLGNGKIAFGTAEGLAIVDPATIDNRTEQATVTFTDIAVNGISLDAADSDYPMDLALPYANEIRLKHDQNSLSLHFSTLDFSNERQPLFTYMLEGYDKTWSAPSTLSFATYKNLAPGTYRLRVKACDVDGTWSNNESTMNIVIEPPLWATPWAYAFYTVIVAVMGYAAIRTLKRMEALRMQVKVEEQLADYKLTFFTNISHEFRTPLTLIQAAMEQMRRDTNDMRERKAAMNMMEKSVGRMLRLINELLEFRKAEKGKLTLSLEETDIIAQLKGIYDTFADNATAKQMEYNFITDTDTYVMPADQGKIDKIVFNLLSNAFKYTPKGGQVTLAAHISNDKRLFTIEVRDNGIGISKQQRKQLFTRFASGNNSRNSIGIGLHLVNELVKAHKGDIKYDENQGGGSVFTVTLPATADSYEPNDYLTDKHTLVDKDKTENYNGNSDDDKPLVTMPMNDRTILVVEDDDDVRALLTGLLAPYANVVAQPDGAAGYEYACANDVDLIICDVMMPGMDGFEVTRRIKEDFATSHIPIILLTALSAEESQLKGAQCGADAYVTKPFSSRILLTRVFKMIEQRDKLKEKFSRDVTAVRPLISTNDRDKEFVDKLTAIVGANLSNSDFNVDEFASTMAIGRTILYRKVKGLTGYTPKEYLRVMRMKKAADMLANTNANVSEVAYAVGMSDPFYFSKCFKQQFGVPPSSYKKDSTEGASAQ